MSEATVNYPDPESVVKGWMARIKQLEDAILDATSVTLRACPFCDAGRHGYGPIPHVASCIVNTIKRNV